MKDFFKRATAPIAFTLALAMGSFPAFSDSARYYEKDVSNSSEKVAQYGAGMIAGKLNGMTFLVYGGNEKLVNAARKVAKRLNAEGKPIGFIQAVDRDKLDITMHVDFYTKSGTKYSVMAFDNDKISIKQTEHDLYTQAKIAYEYEFGKKVSATSQTNEAPVLAANMK